MTGEYPMLNWESRLEITAVEAPESLELEPVLEDDHGEIPDDPDDVYDELLWDKQIQDVREAQAHATGEGTTVAIIDTGVDETHPRPLESRR